MGAPHTLSWCMQPPPPSPARPDPAERGQTRGDSVTGEGLDRLHPPGPRVGPPSPPPPSPHALLANARLEHLRAESVCAPTADRPRPASGGQRQLSPAAAAAKGLEATAAFHINTTYPVTVPGVGTVVRTCTIAHAHARARAGGRDDAGSLAVREVA